MSKEAEIEKVITKTGIADVDGSEMKLFETPVDLPEKVVVVDGKLGKEIGFVERERVTELLRTDPRYEGFEDGCTGKFMLAYSSDGAKMKTIVLETDDVLKFLEVVESNLGTAIGADDLVRSKLGVSYERKGRAYVMFTHIRNFKSAVRFLHPAVVAAVNGSDKLVGEVPADGGPTQRLVDMMGDRG